ncbi:glycosyltransferase family 4 protein [Candidatus Saccharibacteria bacterium]|nr:glycosyltransferase family 4 protein [Candidatus Saccharibacteria bacterium]
MRGINMRIAIIADPYVDIPPKKYGGTELVIHNLIKGLIENGHQPTLFGTKGSEVDCELVSIAQKNVFFPRTSSELPLFNQRIKLINRRTATKLQKRINDFDMIHSHGFDLKEFARYPNITTLHGPITFSNMRYYLERRKLNYISISENQRKAYPGLNYVGTVYNGEDPSNFPIIKKPNNYLCFLGRFDEEKAPDLAIQLAIHLGIPIKLAGKRDFLGYRYFREKIKPYLDHPLVEYLGELGFDDKIKLISHAKCNLHPTYFREPFGLTVMEAAYCGTPTLAIARGAMPELIEHGRTGMLVEDFIEGFHAIQNCFDMNREYIAKRSRKKFNYHNMTKSYIIAYRKVTKKHSQTN